MIDDEQQPDVLPVEQAEQRGDECDECPHFDQRPGLEEREVGKRASRRLRARISDHAAMAPQHLEQPAAPAVALRSERREIIGRLRPSERAGIEPDARRLAARAEMPMQPDRQIHVLADGRVVVAAHGDHRVTSEEAEGSRDDWHRVDRRARNPEELECAHVLDDLEPRKPAARKRHLRDPAPLDPAPVDDRDVAADGDRGRILEERQHRASTRALKVSASMFRTSKPDAALMPAFDASALGRVLLCPRRRGRDPASIDKCRDPRRRDRLLVGERRRHEFERVLQPLQRCDPSIRR